MIIIDNGEMEAALKPYCDVTGTTINEAAEFLLMAKLAEKTGWGDALNSPGPVCEFVKCQKTSHFLKGTELYRSAYDQTRAFINTLLIAERLLTELLTICQKAHLLDSIEDVQLAVAAKQYAERIREKVFH